VNCVKEIYKPFTAQQISDKIAEMLTPDSINSEVKLFSVDRKSSSFLSDHTEIGTLQEIIQLREE